MFTFLNTDPVRQSPAESRVVRHICTPQARQVIFEKLSQRADWFNFTNGRPGATFSLVETGGLCSRWQVAVFGDGPTEEFVIFNEFVEELIHTNYDHSIGQMQVIADLLGLIQKEEVRLSKFPAIESDGTPKGDRVASERTYLRQGINNKLHELDGAMLVEKAWLGDMFVKAMPIYLAALRLCNNIEEINPDETGRRSLFHWNPGPIILQHSPEGQHPISMVESIRQLYVTALKVRGE